MSPRLRRCCALASGVLAAGCASVERERAPIPFVRAGEFGTPGCFLPRTVYDFEVLDDRNLIVFAPSRADAYHVQVSPPNDQLRFAHRIAFESPNSRICGYAGDALMLAEPGSGPRRLTVLGSYRLNEQALAGLRSRFGRGASPRPAAPQPGPGAEIEHE